MTRRKKPQQEEPEAPTLAKYVVKGRQRVHEISPGEVVDLDPEKPETKRLLARGQIVPSLFGVDPDPRGVTTTDDEPDRAVANEE